MKKFDFDPDLQFLDSKNLILFKNWELHIKKIERDCFSGITLHIRFYFELCDEPWDYERSFTQHPDC